MSTNKIDIDEAEAQAVEPWRREVLRAVRETRYGSVEIVIHEGKVVQIETRENVRFDEAGRRSPDNRGRR
jgi:hypothetical protein